MYIIIFTMIKYQIEDNKIILISIFIKYKFVIDLYINIYIRDNV